MDKQIQQAKLAYLLASCHKFNDAFMVAMAKQYSRDVAMLYYFTLYINLHEVDSKFEVKDIYCKFDGSNEPVLKAAIQAHNNEILTDNEMREIYENITGQGIYMDTYQAVAIFSIAALVKQYRHFSYTFVPVIINYGRDAKLMHQSALIVDNKTDTYIYYEPYGMYSKYDLSYKECVRNLFGALGKSVTYHDYFGHSEGIQNIIMTQNNKYADEFQVFYDKTASELEELFPDFKMKEKHHAKDDKTVKVLDLLFHTQLLGVKRMSEETQEKYKQLLRDALEQFYWYNAKTCVSITLIEMNAFFANKDIEQLYNEFRVDRPNVVLMDKIYEMMDVFSNSQDIREVVKENEQSFKICHALFGK